jgi:hypothetical protein
MSNENIKPLRESELTGLKELIRVPYISKNKQNLWFLRVECEEDAKYVHMFINGRITTIDLNSYTKTRFNRGEFIDVEEHFGLVKYLHTGVKYFLYYKILGESLMRLMRALFVVMYSMDCENARMEIIRRFSNLDHEFLSRRVTAEERLLYDEEEGWNESRIENRGREPKQRVIKNPTHKMKCLTSEIQMWRHMIDVNMCKISALESRYPNIAYQLEV